MEPGLESVAIRPLSTPEDMRACEDLQKEVWGFPDREVVPLVELVSVAKSGGCIQGAFHGTDMVGFVYGLWGLDNGRWYHYSRMLAVRKEWRSRGLGRTLKLRQRDYVLERGLNLVRWTFDPLEGPNAALNLGKLGVVANDYIVNYYGMKQDALNRGLPTDRFFVKWHLDSERVRARAAGKRPDFGADEILSGPAPVLSAELQPSGLCRPRPWELPPGVKLARLEIPADIQEIKKIDPGLASAWRMAVREICTRLFGEGWTAEEFASRESGGVRRNAYLLMRTGKG